MHRNPFTMCIWGAQAAGLWFAAARRETYLHASHLTLAKRFSASRKHAFGKLPNATGWQPVLPRYKPDGRDLQSQIEIYNRKLKRQGVAKLADAARPLTNRVRTAPRSMLLLLPPAVANNALFA